MTARHVCALLQCLVIAAATAGQADPFETALRASAEGRYGESAATFHELARNGDGAAAYNLALLFATGRGVPQNEREALYWVWRARLADVPAAPGLLQRLWPPVEPKQRKEIAQRLEEDLAPLVANGDGAAMLQLGAVLSVVRAPPDLMSAYTWQSIAAALDVPGAVSARDATLKSLIGTERAKAQDEALAMFRTWCATQRQPPAACGL